MFFGDTQFLANYVKIETCWNLRLSARLEGTFYLYRILWWCLVRKRKDITIFHRNFIVISRMNLNVIRLHITQWLLHGVIIRFWHLHIYVHFVKLFGQPYFPCLLANWRAISSFGHVLQYYSNLLR